MEAAGFNGFRSLFLLFVCSPLLGSAAPGDENWDDSVGVPGIQGHPAALSFSGHELYVGGYLTSAGDVPVRNIAKWDGTNWSALGSGVNGYVFAIATLGPDVFVGGSFSEAGGINVSNIARWDGTNWAALGPGVAPVSALATIGQELFVGHGFCWQNAASASFIERWDGAGWADVGGALDGPVTVLAASGSELFAGGCFSQAGSVAATNIAKWDGTQWSALGSGLSTAPSAIRVMGSDVYVFSLYSRLFYETRFSLAKWDGSNWLSVVCGDFGIPCCDFMAGANDMIIVGNDFYIGGLFTGIGRCPDGVDFLQASDVAKWDGANWSSLGRGIGGHGNQTVSALAATGDELFVIGNFDSAGGKPSANCAIWRIPYSLSVNLSANGITLSWPATGSNFVLESTVTLGPANWLAVAQPWTIQSGQIIVTNEISSDSRFYRLRRR